MEAVEHAQRDDQRHRSHGNPYDGDAADDVDGVRRFLREEVTPGYVEREIQGLFIQVSEVIASLEVIEVNEVSDDTFAIVFNSIQCSYLLSLTSLTSKIYNLRKLSNVYYLYICINTTKGSNNGSSGANVYEDFWEKLVQKPRILCTFANKMRNCVPCTVASPSSKR